MPEVLSLPLILPPSKPIPKVDRLRQSYQRPAVEAWKRDLQTHRSALGVMFTGAGKTRTAGTFIHEWKNGRVLWLAMRDFLLDQAAEAIGNITDEWIGREQAAQTSRGERIVCGSVQTLKGKRLAGWPKDAFSLIVFDEAHHAVAPGPRAIFNHFDTARIIGLTATPMRLDDIGLHNVFDCVSFEYDIQWGQENGYFCPVVPIARPVTEIDISNVKRSMGDLQLSELEQQILNGAAPIARISWEESEQGKLPTLVYTPGVASAKAVADTLNDIAGKKVAVAVDQDTPAWLRRSILAAFGGEIRFIVNCQIYTEGLDVPLARCIVIARLTESISLYQQMAGRGGRTMIAEYETVEERINAIKNSEKPWFKLVDITGRAGKHTLISSVDALTGRDVSDSVKEEIHQILKSSPGIQLDEATKKAKAEAAKKEREELEKAAKKIAKAAALAEIRTSRTTFDAFSRLGVDVDSDGIAPEWIQQPPTPEQLLWLRDNKLPEKGMTRGKCAQLQKQARKWKKEGKASFRQRKILERASLPVDIMATVASRLISALSDNGWNPRRAKIYTDKILSEGRTVGEEG